MAVDQCSTGGVHDVHAGLAMVADGLAMVLGARTWSLDDADVRQALAQASGLRGSLEAAYLHLVRASVARDDGSRPGLGTAAWLRKTTRATRGRVAQDLANAVVLDPELGDLRELGRALEQGSVSREHVDNARKTLAHVPVAVVRKKRERLSTLLTEHATTFAPVDAQTLAAHLLSVLVPDRSDRWDPERELRRFGSCSVDTTGMTGIRGQLGADGLMVKAVFDHLSAPHRPATGPDGLPVPSLPGVGDTRTKAQRGADAWGLMARLAATAIGLDVAPGEAAATGTGVGTRAGEPARVVVHASVEQLAWVPQDAAAARADGQTGIATPGAATCEQGGGPISFGMLQRQACCAILDLVVLDAAGAVVDLRSVSRYANRAQRRALGARDGGCAWPGCDAPASWCDAHHVQWWTRGGRTVVENLVLLCPRHHTEIHCGEWTMAMVDGVPWFTPPAWLDPDQTPVRNTYRAAVDAAHKIAQQIVLDLDPPPEPPRDTG